MTLFFFVCYQVHEIKEIDSSFQLSHYITRGNPLPSQLRGKSFIIQRPITIQSNAANHNPIQCKFHQSLQISTKAAAD